MKRNRVRRAILYFSALVLMACGAVWIVSHVLAPRLTLRVAIGADQGEAQKFMTALAPLIGQERWRLRFRQVNFDDPIEAARALDAGAIDLMIARSDLAPRAKGRTLAIVRRDVIALIVPPDSTIEKFADIAKRAIAIPAGPLQAQNEALLDQALDYYAIPRASVTRVILPAGEIGQAIRQKRVFAAFVVGPAGFAGSVSEAVASIRKAMRKPPTLLDIGEASAIVKKIPQLEVYEVSRGAVSGNPAIPDDTINTLALPIRLLASSAMGNSLAGDIARIVTTRKSILADALPAAAQIEAPDTEDKSPLLPLHPGAETYFSGERVSLFDQFEYFIYYGGLLASLLASLVAWGVSRARSTRSERDEFSQRMAQMLAAVRDIPNADSAGRLLIQRDLDLHVDWALGELAQGRMSQDNYGIVQAIAARGRELAGRESVGREIVDREAPLTRQAAQ